MAMQQRHGAQDYGAGHTGASTSQISAGKWKLQQTENYKHPLVSIGTNGKIFIRVGEMPDPT